MEMFPYRVKIFPQKLVAPQDPDCAWLSLSPVTFERLQYKQRIAAESNSVHYRRLGLICNRIHYNIANQLPYQLNSDLTVICVVRY